MEIKEVYPLPLECQKCNELECDECDFLGKRFRIKEIDILKSQIILKQKAIKRYEKQIEEIRQKIQKIEKDGV